MRGKIIVTSVVVIALVFISGLTLFGAPASETDRKKKDDLYKKLEMFSDALVLINDEYVDEPKSEDLIRGALKGMLSSLDPYSEFMDAERYNELKVDTEGKFGGLGIEISIKDDILTVITPIEDSPAWKAGMKSGDRIVKINNELTKNITIGEAVKKLRGKPGSEVSLTVLREGESKLLEFKLVRDIIKIKDIKDAMILENHIAYMRLVEFRENTPRDMDTILQKLKNDGMDSLILDLRNNPGGLLDVAVKVVEKFIPEGKIIVYTKGRSANQNMEFKSHYSNPYLDIPMIVLINEGSASGSEIVAGALQDYKRAVLLGKKSFGKGSVQSVLPLADGSALKLTTSKYYTPSGRVISNQGIPPDITVENGKLEFVAEESGMEALFANIENKTPLKEKTTEKTAKDITFDYHKDNQVIHAIDVLKGIKAYKAMSQNKEK